MEWNQYARILGFLVVLYEIHCEMGTNGDVLRNGMESIRQNSWFSGSRLSIEKVLALTYAWAHNFTSSQAVH